jgi:hypothetical protein
MIISIIIIIFIIIITIIITITIIIIIIVVITGRIKDGTRKKDFSDTDLKLAVNACISFQTPEKFFLKSTQKIHNSFSLRDSIRLCDMVRHTYMYIYTIYR